MRRLTAGLVALSLALIAACSGTDDDDDAAPTTVESSTTTAGPTTSAGPTTAVPSVVAPCPAVALPGGATEVTEADAELDGDGAPDTMRTYLLGQAWHLQVEAGAGGGADLELAGADSGGVGLVGGADVDGDGRAEIWSRVGSGASATILGLVRYDACALTRVVLPGGLPVELPVGGSVGSAAGVECRSGEVDGDLTVFSALHREEGRYEVTATQHTLEGATLVPGASDVSEVSAADDEFVRYTSFTCHDLSL